MLHTHTHTHTYIYIYIYIYVYIKTFRKYVENSSPTELWEESEQCTWQCTVGAVMVISGWIVIRINSVWDNICTETQNTHFVLSKYSPKFSFMR